MTSLVVHPVRFSHCEGLTLVEYDSTGQYIVTGGADGDVRVWEEIEDESPNSLQVGECVYGIAVRGTTLLVAADDNTVKAYSFPELNIDGQVARFPSSALSIDLNSDSSFAVIGASDFTAKICSVEDGSYKLLTGHSGPILGVSYDPADVYVATSSCDGSARVWRVADKSLVHCWSQLLPKSNDLDLNKSLSRLAWQRKTGKYLAIPVGKSIKLYARDCWGEPSSDLTEARVDSALSVVAWSYCGAYLAAASLTGGVFVWHVATGELINHHRHKKPHPICGLSWHPDRYTLVFTDVQGNLGCLSEVVPPSAAEPQGSHIDAELADMWGEDLEDDDLIGMDKSCVRESDGVKFALPRVTDDDDSNDFLGGVAETVPEDRLVTPLLPHDLPRPQPAFQPGSTPTHLTSRFMVYNSVGTVISYTEEDSNSIDIEFHDVATHHPLHVNNSLDYSLAALSVDAALFASETREDLPSQLMCLTFTGWDNSREWRTQMPEREEVAACCLGDRWAAAATSRQLIRLFSLAGIQTGLHLLAGPVVTVSGCGPRCLVTYNTGVTGCLGYKFLRVAPRSLRCLDSGPLPLSPMSQLSLSPAPILSWAGFSTEGTPVVMDTSGCVSLLYDSSWVPMADLNRPESSDHYWLVSLEEASQQLRAILCKVSKFPPTLPRPVVSLLPLAIPLCEPGTEKSSFEDAAIRCRLARTPATGNSLETSLRQSLLKMFALACRSERLQRALECCGLMETTEELSLAAQYASRSRLPALAERVNQLISERRDAETSGESSEEDEEEVEEKPSEESPRGSDAESECADDRLADEVIAEPVPEAPILTPAPSSTRDIKNPFKRLLATTPVAPPRSYAAESPVLDPLSEPAEPEISTTPRGIQIFDFMMKGKQTGQTESKSADKRDSANNPKSVVLSTDSKGKKNAKKPSTPRRASAYMLWLKDIRPKLREENPAAKMTDIAKIAGKQWREVDEDTKRKYQELSASEVPVDEGGATTVPVSRKRKDGGVVVDSVAKQPKKLSESTVNKLSNFLRKKPDEVVDNDRTGTECSLEEEE